jgi:hypothetical protein
MNIVMYHTLARQIALSIHGLIENQSRSYLLRPQHQKIQKI